MRKKLSKLKRLTNSGEWQKAASLMEEGPGKNMPDVFSTVLFTAAGNLRIKNKDKAGARKAFEKALKHAVCAVTINARIGLARLDAEKGDISKALGHLRSAVEVGSRACSFIAQEKNGAFKSMFNSKDKAVNLEMKKLTDQKLADEPIRAEIKKALQKAGKEKKKVLLHFYGPYCPYVMLMEERLAHPLLRKLIKEKFVHLRVDHGSFHKAMTIDKEYGGVFRMHGVPSFFILNPDGSIHRIQKCNAEVMSVPHRAYDVKKVYERLNYSFSEKGEKK